MMLYVIIAYHKLYKTSFIADRDLQDEPLQIRIMDYDTYSANDAIGKGKHIFHSLINLLGPVISYLDIIILI